MRLSLDSLDLPQAAEATTAVQPAVVTVADMGVEVTEPLHRLEDDKSSSTMFVLPSTYLSAWSEIETDEFHIASVHCWLAGYEGFVPSSWYVLPLY